PVEPAEAGVIDDWVNVYFSHGIGLSFVFVVETASYLGPKSLRGSWSAQVATTHRQGDAGDVAGLVGGQEQDRAGLLVDAAVALHQRGIDGLVDDLLVPDSFLLALLGRVARNTPRRRLGAARRGGVDANAALGVDRKSTRLNSSHVKISYVVFCLK